MFSKKQQASLKSILVAVGRKWVNCSWLYNLFKAAKLKIT